MAIDAPCFALWLRCCSDDKHSHLHWNHIKAHSQHPFNELVDALAKYAATNFDQVEGSLSWLRWFHDPEALMNLQWLWYLEHLAAGAAAAAAAAAAASTTPTFHDMTLVHTKYQVPSEPDLPSPQETHCPRTLEWRKKYRLP